MIIGLGSDLIVLGGTFKGYGDVLLQELFLNNGRVIADAGSADASPAARALAAGLPTVDDRRAPAEVAGAPGPRVRADRRTGRPDPHRRKR